MMYIIQVGGMIVGSLGQSAIPRLARLFASSQLRKFCLLLASLVGIALALGVFGFLVVAMFGRELALLFYTAEFAEYSPILTIAAVVGAVNYVSAFLVLA